MSPKQQGQRLADTDGHQGEATKASAIETFFAELARRKHEPRLRTATGTVKIELVWPERTERWFVTVDRGEITVSRRNRAADCRVRVDAPVFEKILTEEMHPLAALLRGQVTVDGDLELLLLLQRLLPGRPQGRPVPAGR
jgi:ubiquinone biosynthesis protein UbiJ